jgi:hypothetical protein
LKKLTLLFLSPKKFAWVEDIDDLEKLSEIYAKLESISAVFSGYNQVCLEKPVPANEIYGFWFIFRDICKDLADILKEDYWTWESKALKVVD